MENLKYLILFFVRMFFDIDGEKSQNSYNQSEPEPDSVSANVVASMTEYDPVHVAWEPSWPTKDPRVTLRYGKRTLNGKPYNHRGLDMVSSGRHPRTVFAVCPAVVKTIIKPDKKYPAQHTYVKENLKSMKWKRTAPEGRAWTPRISLIVNIPGHEYDRALIMYKHCDAKIKAGEKINPGTNMGVYGQFGYSFGPHLHFEIRPRKRELILKPGVGRITRYR